MLDRDSGDLNTSIESFMKNHTVLDLLNYGLDNQSLMEDFLTRNGINHLSSKMPGIIVQVYLLLAKKFEFDIFGPLTGNIRETLSDNIQLDAGHQSTESEVILEEIPIQHADANTGRVQKSSG